MNIESSSIQTAIKTVRAQLLYKGQEVKTQKWQADDIDMPFLELVNVSLTMPMERDVSWLETQSKCDLPWALIHFDERVSGQPLNPPPSHDLWNTGTDAYLSGDKFSHSYPERMWSKGLHSGIRFEIADLNTLVEVIKNDPTTRQAYLPIFFPEDLSASLIGERVPCTFGWHFMIRDGKMNCHYPMRSCDAVRHIHNDIYFANRLTLWLIEQTGLDVKPGELFMNISSLHCFKNDSYTLGRLIK